MTRLTNTYLLAVFTNWWTTLTFLLSDPPYEYNTLQIGLFGLVGLFGVGIAPWTGKLLDRMVGWVGQLAALVIQVSDSRPSWLHISDS